MSTGKKFIRAWIGYSDGKPYRYLNEHGQWEWCTFTNRRDARQAFEDVRRCTIVVDQIFPKRAQGKTSGQP